MIRTALFVFLAGAAAIIQFTTIQDDLPDELSILKNSGQHSYAATLDALGAALPSKQVSQYQGWGVFADDTEVVLSRKLPSSTPPEHKQLPAEAYFYLSCTDSGPEFRLILSQTPTYPAGQQSALVSWGPSSQSNWRLLDGRLYAPNPNYLTAAMKTNPMPLTIAGADGVSYAFSLDTGALPELTSNLPAACRM